MASETACFLDSDSCEYQGMNYAYSLQSFPVAVVDNQGKWMFLNGAALAFLGVGSIKDAAGISAADWGGRLRPTDATPSPQDGKTYYVDSRDSKVYHRQSSAIPGKDGKPLGRVESLHDVTALYEGDERVRAMIDAAPLCCNYWNDKFENIDCNLEAAKLFDLPDKKTYLERFFELSPELQPNGQKSADKALMHIKNAFKNGYERFEWMHQKLNGEPVPAEITLVKVKTSTGDVVLGYTRDLRSAKLVTEVDDLDWMTNVFNSLPFPTGVASAAGRWLFLNKAGLALLGKDSVEELAGVSAVDWGGKVEPLASESGSDVLHYIDKSSDRIYSRSSSQLKDSFGGVVGRIECLHDVTDVYEAEERIRAMIDAAPLCCNFWNEKFENIDCNLEAAKLFDLPDKKAYLERFIELSPEYQPNGQKSADKALMHIKNAFKNGFERFNWMHQKLDGEPVPAEITLVRVTSRKGNVVLGYTRDLRPTNC